MSYDLINPGMATLNSVLISTDNAINGFGGGSDSDKHFEVDEGINEFEITKDNLFYLNVDGYNYLYFDIDLIQDGFNANQKIFKFILPLSMRLTNGNIINECFTKFIEKDKYLLPCFTTNDNGISFQQSTKEFGYPGIAISENYESPYNLYLLGELLVEWYPKQTYLKTIENNNIKCKQIDSENSFTLHKSILPNFYVPKEFGEINDKHNRTYWFCDYGYNVGSDDFNNLAYNQQFEFNDYAFGTSFKLMKQNEGWVGNNVNLSTISNITINPNDYVKSMKMFMSLNKEVKEQLSFLGWDSSTNPIKFLIERKNWGFMIYWENCKQSFGTELHSILKYNDSEPYQLFVLPLYAGTYQGSNNTRYDVYFWDKNLYNLNTSDQTNMLDSKKCIHFNGICGGSGDKRKWNTHATITRLPLDLKTNFNDENVSKKIIIYIPKTSAISTINEDIKYDGITNPFVFLSNNRFYDVLPFPSACSYLHTKYNIHTDGIVMGSNIETQVFQLNKLGNNIEINNNAIISIRSDVDAVIIRIDKLETKTDWLSVVDKVLSIADHITSIISNICPKSIIGFSELGLIFKGVKEMWLNGKAIRYFITSYNKADNYDEESILSASATKDLIVSLINDIPSVDLSGYVTNDNLNTKLNSYVTNDNLNTKLISYVTNDNLNTRLNSYVTNDNLNTKLNSYVTNDNLNTKLNSYVTNDKLSSQLGLYYTKDELSNTGISKLLLARDNYNVVVIDQYGITVNTNNPQQHFELAINSGSIVAYNYINNERKEVFSLGSWGIRFGGSGPGGYINKFVDFVDNTSSSVPTCRAVKVYVKQEINKIPPPKDVDLSNYYTITEVNDKINAIPIPPAVDLSNYYTMSQCDNKFALKNQSVNINVNVNEDISKIYPRYTGSASLFDKYLLIEAGVTDLTGDCTDDYTYDSRYSWNIACWGLDVIINLPKDQYNGIKFSYFSKAYNKILTYCYWDGNNWDCQGKKCKIPFIYIVKDSLPANRPSAVIFEDFNLIIEKNETLPINDAIIQISKRLQDSELRDEKIKKALTKLGIPSNELW